MVSGASEDRLHRRSRGDRPQREAQRACAPAHVPRLASSR